MTKTIHLFRIPNDWSNDEALKLMEAFEKQKDTIVVPKGVKHEIITFEKGEKIAIVRENERVARIE